MLTEPHLLEEPSPAWLARWTPLAPVRLCPELVAHQARGLVESWSAWEAVLAVEAAPPPYWAFVWPAAAALARFVLDAPGRVAGRRVVDFACGGGVAAIACARAGASTVVANDIDPLALAVARVNAAANGVELRCDAADRLARADTGAPAFSDGDVIFVADFFYERSTSARGERALRAAAAAGATVYVADAGRTYAPKFPAAPLFECELEVVRDLEGVDARRVRVFELPAR